MIWKDRIKAQDAIGKALVVANLLIERDGIRALRGMAWTDTDKETLSEGLRAFEAMHATERN